MITPWQPEYAQHPRAGLFHTTFDQYASIKAISRSRLHRFEETPAHYAADADELDPFKEAFVFGEALHIALLEPKRFETAIEVAGSDFTRRQKAWPDMAQRALDTRGKLLLTAEESRTLLEMRAAVLSTPFAPVLFASEIREITAVWCDEATKTWCKARIDLLDLGNGIALDLKTTQNADMRRFNYACRDYGYTLQAGMYMEGLEALLPGKIKGFIVMAVEKEAPYRVEVYDMGHHVARGRERFHQHLDTLRACIEADEWPRSHRRPGQPLHIPMLPL